jgi:Ca2+/Na+ antiporter
MGIVLVGFGTGRPETLETDASFMQSGDVTITVGAMVGTFVAVETTVGTDVGDGVTGTIVGNGVTAMMVAVGATVAVGRGTPTAMVSVAWTNTDVPAGVIHQTV